MDVAVITGSAGLIGSEAVRFFSARGFTVAGVDNDMRKYFFGAEASTEWSRRQLEESVPRYRHHALDIRQQEDVDRLFQRYSGDIRIVVHTAAQPSHDWAAREPMTDFTVNALGTLVMLEATRRHCPEAAFIFTSTNKVYGDEHGIDESLSIDQSKHSLFGASKTAADVMVQEYGRYFGMKTAVFRGGCLTGGGHSGTELHGFLSYLMRCCVEGRPYTIFGYQGKLCEEISGRKLSCRYVESNRIGDHIWYVSDVRKFRAHYPAWEYRYDLRAILAAIYDGWQTRTHEHSRAAA